MSQLPNHPPEPTPTTPFLSAFVVDIIGGVAEFIRAVPEILQSQKSTEIAKGPYFLCVLCVLSWL